MRILKASPSTETRRAAPRHAKRGAATARKQRGDALIEALIGTVVASSMGLGLAYTASRMMVSQRYASTENAVLSQLTYSLEGTGLTALCAGSSALTVNVGTQSMTLSTPSCSTAAVTVATSAQSVTLPAGGVVTSLNLATPAQNATAQNLVGGNGVMTINE